MAKISYGARKSLFKEGAKATKLFMVKSGEVLCLKFSKDRLIPVFLAKEGDIVGENVIVDESFYSYSAVTLTPVDLIEIPQENLKKVMDDSPSWLQDLVAIMVSRFQSTANLIAENRVIHPLILEEDKFSSTTEVELKKLLTQ